ncbi:MAG: sulfite exporter TauE/SafE family protein [Acidimicrobiia bacterium]
MDWGLALGGLGVGLVVGLTGMGGGALMTPLLVLVFGIDPLTAVSSDLVASLVMKPFGAGVHVRRGTVNFGLVRWLCVGSVPCAFAGVVVLKQFGGENLQDDIKVLLGIALLLAAVSMVVRQVIQQRRNAATPADGGQHLIRIRPVPTIMIGVIGGFIVGMTSVGSGSLMIVMLLLLYPTLSAGQLVGTDLVQAIPLVGAAALGHILFGDFELGLTTSLLVGAIPGVYLGARVSSRAPDGLIRPILVAVLLISSIKLLGASDDLVLGLFVIALIVGGVLGALALRRRVATPAVKAP